MSRSRWNIAAWGRAATAVLLITTQALAGDVFYSVAISDLKLTEGKLPTADRPARMVSWLDPWVRPQAVLDGDGEVYVRSLGNDSRAVFTGESPEQVGLAIRVPAGRKISGTLFWPKPDWSGTVKLPFTVDAKPDSNGKLKFANAKGFYYRHLLGRDLAGAAWFRHQLRELRGGQADQSDRDAAVNDQVRSLDDTFDLFSGGRAISENLQLDRVLQRIADGDAVVPLDSLKGINVAEINWKPLIKGMQPATDPLARLVPADQHLVLFPNFSALAAVGDRLAQQGTIIMDLAQPRTQRCTIAGALRAAAWPFAFRHRHDCRIARDGQRGADRLRSVLSVGDRRGARF